LSKYTLDNKQHKTSGCHTFGVLGARAECGPFEYRIKMGLWDNL